MATSDKECASPSCTNFALQARHGYCDKHARHMGLIHPRVDADKAKAIIDRLHDDGWTWQAIADAAGMSFRGVRLISRGTRMTVSHDTMQALKSIRRKPKTPHLPAWPTARRVQSLMQAGHTSPVIAKRSGVSQVQVSAIARGEIPMVKRHTAAAIDATFRELMSEPVGTPARHTKGKHWVPPMWWDDIDDPDEKPGITHCTVCHGPDPRPKAGTCHGCGGRLASRRKRQKAKEDRAA